MLEITTNTITNRITARRLTNNMDYKPIIPQRDDTKPNVMNKKKFMLIFNRVGVFVKENPTKIAYLVTITTKQNSCLLSHKECKEKLSMWLELRKKQMVFTSYVWWCEIQHKTTNDIHFHIIVFSDIEKAFDIPNEVKYLNEKFPQTGTNVINIQPVFNGLSGVVYYMLSYMKNKIKSEIFGKVCQCSYDIIKCFNIHKGKYINIEQHSDNIMQHIENKIIFTSEYVTCYYLNIFDKSSLKGAPNLCEIRVNKIEAFKGDLKEFDSEQRNDYANTVKSVVKTVKRPKKLKKLTVYQVKKLIKEKIL